MSISAYLAPSTVDEAIRALEQAGPSAAPFAGGTDVLPQLRAGREFSTIVDLKRIDELMRVERTDDGWLIGAGVPAYRIGDHDDLRLAFPGLVEAVELIGSTQIQGRATIGGNVCNASPAADTVPALLVNDATCLLAGPDGRREIPLSALIDGPGSTTLGPAEILTAVRLPAPGEHVSDAAMRFIPRTEMDIAVANVAVRIGLEDARCVVATVAIGAVGPRAVRVPDAEQALVDATEPTEAVLQVVADACRAAARPLTDKRGTEAYRIHVIGVLASRAVRVAWERARATFPEQDDQTRTPSEGPADEDQPR